ncbi:hypothetical protein HNQ07_004546 [Deinococcus metalli]|uniref:Peptidase C1A papain C-terminal domain-containing protein n=1 Tax=Deinococcus metalli TaxID=1141878 RepID=A0A7W8KL74_9DEIO|nr:C1 family peptidase [Deinococcus metalli]MBB5379036.1 hypothetical protein [Deinococcus metalli]GHF63785.1 hypothetical protein GCM10017781_44630 [Deinococcus metalli]
MPKMVEDGEIQVGAQAFTLQVKPDVFDARDLPYRPKIPLLPERLEPDLDALVLTQVGQSCTGHALAAVINTARAAARRTPRRKRVTLSPDEQASPYMLYALARRYDEFPGTADAGSSLRGALKGWFHHGVLSTREWPELQTDLNLDTDDVRRHAAAMPLGAFYRVNPRRLDDMQSAITELNAVAASGTIHAGWQRPAVMQRGARTLHVIDRAVSDAPLGGHAYALVGYNEIGFVVQNSWGAAWGDRGFAVLPYEDWLESAYDAWVARPGVPAAKLYVSGWENDVRAAGGTLVAVPGPELERLSRYVVNLGAGGRLSDSGRFVSTPAQLRDVVEHMQAFHATQQEAHVVLYAHGGLVSERDGLVGAQEHLNWWLNSGVYPITLAWQSGPGETLYSQLASSLGLRLPAGGLGQELVEGFDRMVEGVAGRLIRWLWQEMKANARAAGDATDEAGGTQLLDLLAQAAGSETYRTRPLRVHLVGHSAGSVMVGALLARLAERQLRAESVQFLAPAMTVQEFADVVLPHLGGPAADVERFALFTLTEQDELDDTCSYAGITPYHKSLLYLVARALETPGTETPLLGMAKYHTRPLLPGGQTLADTFQDLGVVCVSRGSATQADALTDARAHGAFDDDKPTMTSVLLRILNQQAVNGRDYTPNAALNPTVSAAGDPVAAPRPAGGPPVAGAAPAPGLAAPPRVGERPLSPPPPPVPSNPQVDEVAAPSSGRVIVDRMLRNGWTPVKEPGDLPPPPRRRRKAPRGT